MLDFPGCVGKFRKHISKIKSETGLRAKRTFSCFNGGFNVIPRFRLHLVKEENHWTWYRVRSGIRDEVCQNKDLAKTVKKMEINMNLIQLQSYVCVIQVVYLTFRTRTFTKTVIMNAPF